MENIVITVVVITESGLAKDIHPLGIRPPNEGLNTEKWDEINATLRSYKISSIVTDEGKTISSEILHFHIGKTYKVEMDMSNEGNCVQIIQNQK